MAKRSSNKNNDDGMGCLFAMFDLLVAMLLLLFTSEDPTVRKIGWGIVGIIAFLWILSSEGLSGESAILLVVVIVIISVVLLIISAFNTDSGKSANDTHVDEISTANKNSQVTEKTAIMAAKVEKPMSFDEQLKKMELEVKAVCGDDFRTEKIEWKKQVTKKESLPVVECEVTEQKLKAKYYRSVAEAVEQQNVPAGYQKIMIERIQKTDIKECPGVIWKDDVMLYVLPLLHSAKIYNWPLSSVPIILYEKRVDPDVDKEFKEALQSEIASEFEEVFPEYRFGQESTFTGKFILPIGLEVTNTSGKILVDMIPAEFHVVDDITQSLWYEKEIKELYQKNILKENGIISYMKYVEDRERLLNAYKEREKNGEKYEQQIQAARELELL